MVVGDLTEETEVAVIGAGPGGYVAALHAADLGKNVILIERRDRPGGACLIEGCIPSKTLVSAVAVAEAAKRARVLGLSFSDVRFDPAVLREFTQSVVDGLTKGVTALLKGRGVTVVHGTARFQGDRTLRISGSGDASPEVTAVKFEDCVIATGASDALPDFAREAGVWTSTDALALPSVPGTLLVVGAGYIGMELASVYAGLGARVTVADAAPTILSDFDADLVRVVERAAKERFEAILTGAHVVEVRKEGDGFAVDFERGGKTERMNFDRVLFTVGRRPNTGDLGLTEAGVALGDHGFVVVDERRRTSAEHIYAVGDVTPGPMLAHKASREAKVAAEVIAGRPSAFDNRAVPFAVFTDPEIAAAGLSEKAAKDIGREVKIGRFPLSALGRARTVNRAEGMVKIVSDPDSGAVLGVGIAAPNASELIAEGALAMEMGATLEDLLTTIHPHPTFSESVMEAAEAATGFPTHLAKKIR